MNASSECIYSVCDKSNLHILGTLVQYRICVVNKYIEVADDESNMRQCAVINENSNVSLFLSFH